MTARSAAAGVLVAGALAAACGGGPTIAKAELLRRGDAICREEQARIQAEVAASEGRTEAALIGSVLLPGLRAMFDEVEALGTPSGDGDELGDVYDRIDALVSEAGAASPPADLAARFEQVQSDLEAYGFEDCGQVAS